MALAQLADWLPFGLEVQSSNHVIGNLKNVLPNILLTYLTRADLGINRVVVLVLRFFICKVIYTKVE